MLNIVLGSFVLLLLATISYQLTLDYSITLARYPSP